jgi:hypothetical protein
MPITSVNFGDQYRGMKDCQGLVHSGPTAASTYQTQYHAPLTADYAYLPNGRVVYVDNFGELTPICPVDAPGKMAMPLLLNEGGNRVSQVPQTYSSSANKEAPYRTAIPQPRPNVLALPLCTGYEFLTTEYDPEQTYTYNTALTSATDTTVIGGVPVGLTGTALGVIIPLTATSEMCIGFVSQKPGQPRQYGDPATFTKDAPNPMMSVTGKNRPGLSFWGCPLPCGVVSN